KTVFFPRQPRPTYSNNPHDPKTTRHCQQDPFHPVFLLTSNGCELTWCLSAFDRGLVKYDYTRSISRERVRSPANLQPSTFILSWFRQRPARHQALGTPALHLLGRCSPEDR